MVGEQAERWVEVGHLAVAVTAQLVEGVAAGEPAGAGAGDPGEDDAGVLDE